MRGDRPTPPADDGGRASRFARWVLAVALVLGPAPARFVFTENERLGPGSGAPVPSVTHAAASSLIDAAMLAGLTLMVRLLETTPPGAIKLPYGVSVAAIGAGAWLLALSTGAAQGEPASVLTPAIAAAAALLPWARRAGHGWWARVFPPRHPPPTPEPPSPLGASPWTLVPITWLVAGRANLPGYSLFALGLPALPLAYLAFRLFFRSIHNGADPARPARLHRLARVGRAWPVAAWPLLSCSVLMIVIAAAAENQPRP